MPFQRSTTGSLEAPSPIVKRPAAASAIAATLMASSPGPRVKAGVTATPSLRRGSQAAASGERREAVGAVDLGGPDVGVAEVGELGGTSRGARAA